MPVTAKSFMLVNATAEKVAQLDVALKYLQERSPNMARPILEAAAENQVRIVFSDPLVNADDAYGEGQHAVVWDPGVGLVVVNSSGSEIGVQSAANGLFHEIAHSIDIDQAARANPRSFPNAQYQSDSEAMAVIYADAVAKDCGEVQRNNYKGNDIKTPNVTAHTSPDGMWHQVNSLGQDETGPRFRPGQPVPAYGYPGNEHDYDPPSPGGGGGGGDPSSGPGYPGDPPSPFSDRDYGDYGGNYGSGYGFYASGSGNFGDPPSPTYSQAKQARGYRIITESDASLVCSGTLPIPARGKSLLTPEKLLREQVAVRRDEAGRPVSGWETVTKVEVAGVLKLQHFTVGDKCFWAGTSHLQGADPAQLVGVAAPPPMDGIGLM